MSSPHVVLIDNYDSFTWNVYEVLSREGARVSVYRNDKITVPEIEALKPDHILISPGPGNPENDSGVSREIITHFMGKVPIFGICMGLQCMVSVLGGKVESAGEIFHGKTSSITHNNTGCFRGVSQGVSATRYHSLAANFELLPSCLEVTAKLEESGIVQGIRHKEYILEGVQFHPESILTQEGNVMLRNFLRYTGGKWTDLSNTNAVNKSTNDTQSILDRIYAQRKLDVAAQEVILGQKLEDLERSIEMGLAPEQVDFEAALKRNGSSGKMSLIAEIKRASPSKGSIAPQIHAPSLAVEYANAGASAISVLTEPKWFKGTLEDMRLVRKALDTTKVEPRPAVLRKEFVFSDYQIAEARLAGADTVLLIVKMLSDSELYSLYNYSKKLNMEPLVEVSNTTEMQRALKLGAKVIGINNRDLHSFTVDMNTTSSLISNIDKDSIVLAALSGISGPKQVADYAKEGVKAVLVGESLVRAENTAEFAKSLIDIQ